MLFLFTIDFQSVQEPVPEPTPEPTPEPIPEVAPPLDVATSSDSDVSTMFNLFFSLGIIERSSKPQY